MNIHIIARMAGDLEPLLFLVVLIIPSLLMAWAIRPLLSLRDSDTYKRFVLSDMYALVLQIAAAGMTLRQWTTDDERFLVSLGCLALVLALIWRFIVAALDDNEIRGGIPRMIVLVVAPVQIMGGIAVPISGYVILTMRKTEMNQGYGLIVLGIAIPLLARLIYAWALRTKSPTDVPPVSGN